MSDCALAIGFEKMERGSLGTKYTDRTNPMDKHVMALGELREWEQAPFAPQMFGMAGREHMEKYGSTPEHYAWIGWKNHKHSVNNPYAQFQTEYSLQDIKDAQEIYAPLTKLQCSPTSDGAAAAVIASERFVDEHDLWDRAVELAGPGDGHRRARDVQRAVGDHARRRPHERPRRRSRRSRRRRPASTRSTSSNCTTASAPTS